MVMAVLNTVYCIFVIITCLTLRDVEGGISIRAYYNRVETKGCTKELNGKCHYKDGDQLMIICDRNHYSRSTSVLNVYHCRNGHLMNNEKGNETHADLRKCAATGYLNQNQVTTNIKLTNKNDKDVVICEYSKNSDLHEVQKRWSTTLVFQPDAPPTIIINHNLHYNKSSASLNVYQSKIGESVKIVCKNNEKDGTLQWDYCKNITKESCLTQEKNVSEITYANLILDEKVIGTEIKCVYNNLNKKKTNTSVLFYLTSDNKAVANGNIISDGQDNKEFIGSHYMWVIVGVGTLIIIILIIITVNFYVYRKSCQKTEQEEITYENLSSEVATPSTFPNLSKLEEIYLNPSDCKETDSRTTDNDIYTQPHEDTKPMPKSLRNAKPHSEKTPKNINTNELSYAEIEAVVNVSRRRNNTEYPTTNEPSYAEIETVSHNYNKRRNNTGNATTNYNPNYTNVFVNETYVNAKDKVGNDYAEPAYCEIGKSMK